MFIACIALNETSSIGAKCLFVVRGYMPLQKEFIEFRLLETMNILPFRGLGINASTSF